MGTTPPTNALPITGRSIPNIDFEEPLREVEQRSCLYFDDAYFREAAKTADPDVADLYRSLGIICSFFPQYWNRAQPYRAAWMGPEGRSNIPDDLSTADIDILDALLPRSKEVALRARLADILWLRKKDRHDIARGAVRDYVAAAEHLLAPLYWVHAVELFHRAMQLAARLGRDKEEYRLAETGLLQALQHPLSQTEPFFANHFLQLILALGIGDANVMADTARAHADLAVSDNDPSRRRGYHHLEAEFRRAAGDMQRASEATLLAAETYVEEADDAVKRTPPSYIAAADALAKGIEALRQARATPEKIGALKHTLKEYQKRTWSEMQTIRIPLSDKYVRNIEAAATAARKYVTHDDLKRSLILLALGMDCLSVPELKEQVLKGIEQAPFIHIIGQSMVDAEGRVTGHSNPLLGLTGEEAEHELEKRMFRHAAEFDWKSRVGMFVEPARDEIWVQHRPRKRELEYLVFHNPVIPPGHEGIFLDGLYYGLAGDWMIAVHLLTPQIENSIRYVLEQRGADVANLNSDLTQEVKTLGALLDMPEATAIFGPNLVFEMRGLLIEKHGYAFRNDLAHGFLTLGDCYGPAAINVWWLVLKLCHLTMILPPDLSESDPA